MHGRWIAALGLSVLANALAALLVAALLLRAPEPAPERSAVTPVLLVARPALQPAATPAPAAAPSGPVLQREPAPARPAAARPQPGPSPSPVVSLDPAPLPSPAPPSSPLRQPSGAAPVSPPPSVLARRPAPAAADDKASFMQRVLGAGAVGPLASPAQLDRALERPEPNAWLVPGVERDSELRQAAVAEDVVAQLVPTADGGYSYQGSQIRAEIFADGSVLLYDPPHVRAQLLGVPIERLPLLLQDPRAEIHRAIAERKRELKAAAAEGGLPLNDDAVTALSVLNILLTGNSIGGVFDITETAMRAVGEDPYASMKMCFLSETEGLRDRLLESHRARVARLALQGLHAHLCKVWADQSKPVVERRATIFQLWDECDDTDDGRRAREIIVAFVREQIPKASAQAYSAVELMRLNARRTSTELFAPYRHALRSEPTAPVDSGHPG